MMHRNPPTENPKDRSVLPGFWPGFNNIVRSFDCLEQQGSSILELVRACVGTSCATVSAADAATALAQLPTAQPGVVVIDQSLDPAEAELLAGGLADAGLDAIPLITIDPSQPISASDLRARVLAALHVSRRVWFGGGLRSRMVA